MTAPGDLNRRLLLEAPAETEDGAGGVMRLYDIVTTLWAQVVPLAAAASVAPASCTKCRRRGALPHCRSRPQ